jgi:hypothetical protein
VLISEYLNASQPEEIDRFAKENGLVMQVSAPIFVGGRQKGR